MSVAHGTSPTSGAYSALAKLLHYLAMDSRLVAQTVFDLERALYLRRAPSRTAVKAAKHVFITGLARSGTTMLLQALYASAAFASLTYANLPFALSPNAWLGISRRYFGDIAPRERAHGDGIIVDSTSPEALDEIFWRALHGSEYIDAHEIRRHRPAPHALESFVDYIRLVLHACAKDRYLSKNNNNVMRIEALTQLFPNSLFLVPFRRPLDHAASLLRQHHRFSNVDTFTLKYMQWLGHYEFGSGHRRLALGPAPTTEAPKSSIDYWLGLWIRVYQHLEEMTHERAVPLRFLAYEELCHDPAVWSRLRELVGVSDPAAPPFRPTVGEPVLTATKDLVARADALYERLRVRARTQLDL